MATWMDGFWQKRLDRCKAALEANRFGAQIAEDPEAAGRLITGSIAPAAGAVTVSWGDSMTLLATGALEGFRADPNIRVIETFDPSADQAELIERRRDALTVDLFLTGTNAVTEAGQLVNLDMVGNRVAGITFGPRRVVIVVGRNKLVLDVAAAMDRIRSHAAPLNAIRHNFPTPCAETGRCEDCNSPRRICNTWTITEKAYPPGRIQVILINRDLGL